MTASPGRKQQLTSEQYMVLQEALAISSALSAADHLGVLARLDAGSADSITIARDCAISERGARLLLAALCSLGLIEEGSDGLYHAALPDLAQMTMWITPWGQLTQAIRDDQPARAGDTPGGAETLYPEVVAHLGAWFAPAAERAAGHLIARGQRVLDLGAGGSHRRAESAELAAIHLARQVLDLRRAAEREHVGRARAGDLLRGGRGGEMTGAVTVLGRASRRPRRAIPRRPARSRVRRRRPAV